jgi:hypothetical protein
MPFTSIAYRGGSRGRRKGKRPNVIPALLAFAMFSAGCSNGEIGPASPVVSHPPLDVAPIEIPARNTQVSYLYVADNANSENAQVDLLLRKNLAKGIVGKIRKRIQYPAGIFIDPSDTLYVANGLESGGHDTVTAYKPGTKKPFRIYRGFCFAVDALAGPDGSVYIADGCGGNAPVIAHARSDSCVENGAVHIYAAGGTKQIRELPFKGGPFSLTLDDKDNLYVGYENACGYKGQVRRYAPGAVKGVDLLPPNTIFSIGGIALDSRGELLVVDVLRGRIDVFSAEHEPPSRIITTGQSLPDRLVFDNLENRLYVTSPYLPDLRRRLNQQSRAQRFPKRPNTLVVIDYPSGKLLHTLRKLVFGWVPSGVAVFPPAPFGPEF